MHARWMMRTISLYNAQVCFLWFIQLIQYGIKMNTETQGLNSDRTHIVIPTTHRSKGKRELQDKQDRINGAQQMCKLQKKKKI